MESSVAAAMPELAARWHPTKNGKATADSTDIASGQFVWWLCPSGHEWEVKVRTQAKKGDLCPVCSGKRRASIASTHPELAKTFHPTKNGRIGIDQVNEAHAASYWWLCPQGHTWKSSVSAVLNGTKTCPQCEPPRPRSLDATHPKLAALWHPRRNRNLTPADVQPDSERQIWWLCPQGHEWNERVSEQVKRRVPCPQCRIHERPPVSATHPLLMSEWDFDKNRNISPDHVTFGSSKKVWWRCDQGHSWEATLSSRTVSGTNCPRCRRSQRVFLSHSHPELAEQWDEYYHPSLNPHQIGPLSERVVGWVCPEAGHRWTSSVSARTVHGANCPHCDPRRAAPMMLTHPIEASFWNAKQNARPTPGKTTAISARAVWWSCSLGHEWYQSPQVFVAKHGGCPVCAESRLPSSLRKHHA